MLSARRQRSKRRLSLAPVPNTTERLSEACLRLSTMMHVAQLSHHLLLRMGVASAARTRSSSTASTAYTGADGGTERHSHSPDRARRAGSAAGGSALPAGRWT